MKRLTIIVVLFGCILSMEVSAQGWVIAGTGGVSINGEDPSQIYVRPGASSVSISGFGGAYVYRSEENIGYFKMSGTGALPSGTKTVSFSLEGDGPSFGDYTVTGSSSYNFGTGIGCGAITFFSNPATNNPSVSGFVTLYFFPRMTITGPTSTCGNITLTTSRCDSESSDLTLQTDILWEVSDTPTSAWVPITKATGASTVTMTPSEFSTLGLTKFGKKYFRVTGVPGTTSEVKIIDVYVAPPTISLTPLDPKCNNDFTGSIKVDISSTDPAVNQFTLRLFKPSAGDLIGTDYPLTAGQVTTTITGLDYGGYTAQVTNVAAGSCNTTSSTTLINPTKVNVNFTTSNYNGYGVSCNGGANGFITINGTGGAGGYSNFAWNTGKNSQTITGLSAGSYTGSLTDSKGCAASGNITLTPPLPLTATLSATTNYGGYAVQCWNTPNGGMRVTPTGGVSGYTYNWSTGATSSTITGLAASTAYSVTVTDANGCTRSSSLTLTAPTPIDFSIQQVTPLNCPGDANAALQANPVMTTIIGAADYSWSTGAATQSISNVAAGTYTVTVSDDQTCSTTKSITLAPPPAHTVAVAPTSNFNGAFIKCNGQANGVLTTTVRDATNTIVTAQNYEWFKGTTPLGSSPSLSSLSALDEGMYKVVITYGSGCKAERQYFLGDPDPMISSISPTTNYNGQPISCANLTDANLRATSSGGTGAHTYTWNTSATGALLTGVGAGSYSVNVTDLNGCVATANYTLNNPSPVVASIASVSDFSGYGVSCNGSTNGVIVAEGSGGTGEYSFNWSNGKNTALNNNLPAGNYTVTVRDENGCSHAVQQTLTAPSAVTITVVDKKNINCFNGSDGYIKLLAGGGVGSFQYSKDGSTWQSNDTFTSLPQGNYTLRTRDANGCSINTTSSLTQPAQITISFTDVVAATCSNPTGSAKAVVAGGTGAYAYLWQDASLNTVDSDAQLSNAPGGIYTLFIKDANLCERSANVSISSVDGAQATYTTVPSKCFDSADGSARITITSGVGPFSITWPDGQTNLQAVNLKKDTYAVLIKDANNCTVVKSIVVPGPNPMALQIQNSVHPTCKGSCDGQITLTATGGVGGYAYQWNSSNSATQSDLCAGSYTVILKDANNCTLQSDISLSEPDEIDLNVSNITMPSCKDKCDGALSIEGTGGNGTYTYSWNVGGTTNSMSNLCPGDYSVVVADKLGCSNELSIELPNAPDLPIDLGGGATVCVGQAYSLHAGNNWRTIVWGSNTGLSSDEPSITVHESGAYWVEVSNELGCVGQDTFLLETSNDLLNASFIMSGEAFAGDTIIMIDVSWPLPESIHWTLPMEMNKIEDLGDVISGTFNDPGTYQIRLTAHLGECLGEIAKSISILERIEENEGGRLGYEKYVRAFTLHPNPNNGSFQVYVELAEKESATLSVWHSSGRLIKTFPLEGNNVYAPFLNTGNLSPGAYILRLDHRKGNNYIRFIAH
ncbi:hypothetical protein [Pseudochryseolinea flava]|nr:hypothetical protein [Pseudochryseolinea flava]